VRIASGAPKYLAWLESALAPEPGPAEGA